MLGIMAAIVLVLSAVNGLVCRLGYQWEETGRDS